MTAGDPQVVWHLATEWRRKLLSSDGRLRLQQWLADGTATVFKHAPHRTIYRIATGTYDIFLKEYRAVALRGWLRELIRSVKARREHAKAEYLAARGISVPKSIGWGMLGSRLSPQASFVVSETLKDARPLSEFLNDLTATAHQDIANSLGEFVAKMHSAGAVHRDFHPGNLMIDADGQIVLIDLHEVRCHRSCSWQQKRDNLITLNRWFMLRSSRTDRLRFWRAYQRFATLPDHADAQPQALESATIESNVAFWKTRERRHRSGNRHLRRVSDANYAGWAVNDLDSAISNQLHQPDDLFSLPSTEMLKEGRSSTVARIRSASPSMILKRFNMRSWFDPWKNLFRTSPAFHSWMMGHALMDAGLPTARPLAILQKKDRGRPGTGYLLNDDLGEVEDLRAFADRLLTLSPTQRRKLLRQRMAVVARTLRLFHERHFGHRDLKAANLLTPKDFNDQRVWFVDLVGVQRRRPNAKAQIRDLSRLLVSFLSYPTLTRSDRLRFLRDYMAWNLHGKTGWKTWWRQLSELAQTKVARNLRVGRPLA